MDETRPDTPWAAAFERAGHRGPRARRHAGAGGPPDRSAALETARRSDGSPKEPLEIQSTASDHQSERALIPAGGPVETGSTGTSILSDAGPAWGRKGEDS